MQEEPQQDADFHGDPYKKDHTARGWTLRHYRKCKDQDPQLERNSFWLVEADLSWWAAGRQYTLTTTFKGSPPFILCWDSVMVLRKGRRRLTPLPRRISIRERRLNCLYCTVRWMRMTELIAFVENVRLVNVLEFSWRDTLTGINVAGVVWLAASTKQETSPCIW